ncbi:hypothetical protein WJX72_001194 [[Myrmecia] bisecta]|uniref:Fe2OG dioxygenase domain-containing protein n=1 Tax=[Myrmecia] bisecta TaxID=41462 RepID=A0AAW1P6C2_9CHLO
MTVSNLPPVVDLSNFEERKAQITEDLMKAATTIGFFYIKGHGLEPELIDQAFATNAQYFNQPEEAKLKLPRVDWGARKLIGFERNTVPGGSIVHESSIQCFEVHEKMKSAWPDPAVVPGYREKTIEFMQSLAPVVDKILSCLALGLGFPKDFFLEKTNVKDPDNHTFLQYHKYPSTDGLSWKEGTNRITAHTDESLITLLFTSPNSTGLELAAGRDGKAVNSEAGEYKVDRWTPCPPLPGAITVNVGDPLQFLSDGKLLSNYHRVRMPRPGEPQDDRYSIGYFVWPRDYDVIQGPLKKYPAITMAEFMKTKGAMYGASFHPDPEVYEANQHIAFGPPTPIAVE